MEIAEFIAKTEQEFDMPQGILKPDSKFKEVINWSSINAVVLSTMIEFECGVMLNADELKTVNTVSELLKLISLKKKS